MAEPPASTEPSRGRPPTDKVVSTPRNKTKWLAATPQNDTNSDLNRLKHYFAAIELDETITKARLLVGERKIDEALKRLLKLRLERKYIPNSLLAFMERLIPNATHRDVMASALRFLFEHTKNRAVRIGCITS